MINPERIKFEARRSAEQILANEAAQQAADEERWAQERIKQQAKNAKYELQKPQLQEQARREHQARFRPLQEILNQLAEPVRVIRDEYFPGSPVVVADHYEGSYWEGPGRRQNNSYYRALMVLDRDALPGTIHGLLGIYVMAEEPARRKFAMFGPYKNTRYNVGIGLHIPSLHIPLFERYQI